MCDFRSLPAHPIATRVVQSCNMLLQFCWSHEISEAKNLCPTIITCFHSKLFGAWLATYSQHAQEMACFLVHLVTFGSCWRLVTRGSMDQWLSCPRKKPSTADERLHKFRLFFSCIHFLNPLTKLNVLPHPCIIAASPLAIEPRSFL